jgi:hypothetical protein
MAEKDFMDTAVSEWMEGEIKKPDDQEIAPEPQPNNVAEEQPPVPPAETPIPEPIKTLTEDEILKEFNRVSGLNFDSFDKVKTLAESATKLPELEERASLIPELLDTIEKIQNPLNYFSDETAFKVSQLAKDERYKGKESIVNEILRNDLNTFDDLHVIQLASNLNAKQGVRNPLRAELKGMNIDPDDVIGNYDDLDDDTKDLLKIKADHYRDELKKIGEGISLPSFEGTKIEQMIAQKKVAKEDFEAKRSKILPVAEGIINEVKELKLTDDFNFKLDLSPDQVKEYSAELADLLSSGQYDISTDAGKNEVFGAILDMFKSDFFDKAIAALVTHKTSKIEEEMRRKFNNEAPLKGSEPPPTGTQDNKDLFTRIAEQMVAFAK